MDTPKRIVTKIEANPLLSRSKNDFKILRVAAYRVDSLLPQ